MNKITAVMLVLILVTLNCLNLCSLVNVASETITDTDGSLITRVQSNSILYPTHSPIENSSQSPQSSSLKGTQQVSLPPGKKSSLPSPFMIAALIVALVEVFGLILSLCLRKRSKRDAHKAYGRSCGKLMKNLLLCMFFKKSKNLVILCTL